MFKRVKIAYKKVHSFLFGQEEEHIHTKEERKKYYGRITTDIDTSARMIHQYPKQGNFRFPIINDEKKPARTIPSSEGENVRPVRKITEKKVEQSETVFSHEKQSEQKVFPGKDEARKKFQGVNFKAQNIPSPVYAFNKPQTKIENKFEEEVAPTLELIENQVFLPNENDEVPKLINNDIPLELEAINTKRVIVSNELLNIKNGELFQENINAEFEIEENGQNREVDEVCQTEPFEKQLAFDKDEKIDEGIVELIGNDRDAITYKGAHKEEIFEEEIIPTLNIENIETVAPVETFDESKGKDSEHIQKKNCGLTEHSTSMVNTNINKSKKTTQDASSKNIVPFNVLMFKKDKAAQKKLEQNNYQFPTLQLLNIPEKKSGDSNQWLEEKKQLLEATLINFNVQAKVVGVTRGPSVTRFEIQPEAGVKVSKVTGLTDDIKLSLAARDIRMEAPIPGKNAIGIEVPNDVSSPVFIREILRSGEFLNNPSPLTVAMGLDIEGKPVVTDIQKMPHGLIAGSTGSGKSVCINSILISIMFKATPDQVKLMLVDPKMVELAPYNNIPHLVTPVITDAKQATIALKWAVEEMERRYELFVQNGVRDIKRYNDVMKKDNDTTLAMPYIVIVIDELADLMMVSPQDVEEAICRIAQKARACGIHLLLATQRPSVDVITGLIKANIPSRIAFSVSSQADSRTIIDSGGAERLLGKGDMLLFENGASKPIRVQGNFVSDEEIDRVISLVKQQRKPDYLFDKEQLVKTYEAIDQEDELFVEACYYVIEQGVASSSSLQRRFRIGFNRAARLIDMMESRGIISEAMGSKPRNVLISEEELHGRI
ncbi:DNA translocase FtsK [Anaerobacillus alkalilacustris]|uniref:DNA translocase FtsK n=1 Tax=Anaerobacillus alkalilacustris TaxID=393763 RepID=UPI000A00C9AE|nr:DNA translocase FtsK [Anaerobacillus alkalilacustris]